MTLPESRLDIRSRLASAKLPAMPQILAKLMECCQTEDIGIPELAGLIAKDAAMTAKILRVANSAKYRHRVPQVTLEQALASIGIDMVKTVVVSESACHLFDTISSINGDDLRGFWRHSLNAAVIARLIAEKMGDVPVEEAYIAGLLHDVGRLALLVIAPKKYGLSFFAPDDDSLCALEQRTLQMTHAEAGAYLIEYWGLDSFLADSVLYHHEPVERLQNAPKLVRICCLTHHLTAPEPSRYLKAAASLCGLIPEDLEAVSNAAAEQVAVEAAFLGIHLDDSDGTQAAAPSDNPAQRQLGEQVSNLVLTTELQRNWGKQTDGELVHAILCSALILFYFSDAVLFLVDSSGQFLKGSATGEQQRCLSEFAIPMAGKGLIAQAALQRRVTIIDDTKNLISIAEDQLCRILRADCLVCLPLCNKEHCTGVLVGGAKLWQIEELQNRKIFLQAFGTHAANVLKLAAGVSRAVPGDAGGVPEQYLLASKRVAHEVNNPLSIIKNYLSVLDRKLARNEPIAGELSILNEEIDRIAKLINGFAEIQPAQVSRPTDINAVVNDVMRLFSSTEYFPPSVKIVIQMQDEPCEVDGDVGSLKQILMNLIKNAIEALPDGGEIEIGNNGLVNREGRLFSELWIRDNGPGIAAPVMRNLFSPVHSTKGDSHRGLGLSIVHSLVTQMQGVIHCRTGKKGTTFDLLIPAPRLAEQVPTGRAKIRTLAVQ